MRFCAVRDGGGAVHFRVRSNAPYDPRERHSCEAGTQRLRASARVAPGFRLALRASGMTVVGVLQLTGWGRVGISAHPDWERWMTFEIAFAS